MQRRSLDVAAANIANMNTTGFRAQKSVFAEYVAGSYPGNAPDTTRTSFTLEHASYLDTTAGSLVQTDNPLNIALLGDGFFQVTGTDGNPAWSRDGNLSLDPLGRLVTSDGRAVLGAGGGEILIAPEAGAISISPTGIVSQADQEIGQIALSEFAYPAAMRALGDSTYRPADGDGPIPADNTRIAQFMVESSNVNPIAEMTRMIDIQRSYQQVKDVVEREDERQKKATDRIVR